MKISQEVREFARLQNQPAEGFIAATNPSPPAGEGQLAAGKQGEGLPRRGAENAEGMTEEEAEAGMAQMSKVYDETGRELYMGAGDREHD